MRRPLQGITRGNILREMLAGLTLLAISVPLNIGYAQIAGLPAAAGLYALVVPTLAYVALASSRHVVASPDAAAAALVFSSLVGLGVGEADFAAMAAAQAIVCGALLALASVFRLGFLATFLSHPILQGFVAGLALEVLLSQARKMLGTPHGEAAGFLPELAELVAGLGGASVPSVLLSVASLTVLLAGRRLLPSAPWALLVLVAGTAAVAAFGLEGRGVAVLGPVAAGPPQFAVPMLDIGQWLSLIPSALALAMITMAEGVMMSRSYGRLHGYPTYADRDVLAFGAANVAAGLSMSFAVGSSTSRSAAMDQAGARSQLPSIVLAVGTVGLLLFGTDALALIPAPVIGAVVAVAVARLLGWSELRELARRSGYELAIALVCVLGVILLGPLQGLVIAFFLSLVNLARRAAAAHIDVLAPSPVVVVRIAGPVFFANGTAVEESIRSATVAPGVFALVVDAEGIGDVDVTGADALRRALDEVRSRGVIVAVARLRPALRARMEHLEALGEVREFATNRSALKTLRAESVDVRNLEM